MFTHGQQVLILVPTAFHCSSLTLTCHLFCPLLVPLFQGPVCPQSVPVSTAHSKWLFSFFCMSRPQHCLHLKSLPSLHSGVEGTFVCMACSWGHSHRLEASRDSGLCWVIHKWASLPAQQGIKSHRTATSFLPALDAAALGSFSRQKARAGDSWERISRVQIRGRRLQHSAEQGLHWNSWGV